MARIKPKPGNLSINELRSLINKKAGMPVAHDLTGDNPTEVKLWIPTGSTWLNSIICRGKSAGIPVGKVTEIAGMEASGKSYMAAQTCANAQKMGIKVAYFDSESSIDPKFLERSGVDLDEILYIQATSVEFVLETIETLLTASDDKYLFVWDSLAQTPAVSDVEGSFNPNESVAVKARVLAKGMSKLTLSLANSQSAFLVLNQLKTNLQVVNPKYATDSEKYVTPGGKSMAYTYSLRIWLTGKRGKSSVIVDDKGFKIGNEVKARLEKSRFGTAGRICNFKIMWADDVGVRDDESLFEAIQSSEHISSAGAWWTLKFEDGTSQKFQSAKWLEHMKDEKFRSRVMQLLDEEVVLKFDERTADASTFYDNDDEDGDAE
jgi:recombination protein RecA